MGFFDLFLAKPDLDVVSLFYDRPELVLDAVGIMVSTVVPLIVLFVTLAFGRRQQKA